MHFLCKGKEILWEGPGSHLGVSIRLEYDSRGLVTSFTLKEYWAQGPSPEIYVNPCRLLRWFWCVQLPLTLYPALFSLHDSAPAAASPSDFCLWALQPPAPPHFPCPSGQSPAIFASLVLYPRVTNVNSFTKVPSSLRTPRKCFWSSLQQYFWMLLKNRILKKTGLKISVLTLYYLSRNSWYS